MAAIAFELISAIPSATASGPTVFESTIVGTDGCVYSNSPLNSHLCCDKTVYSSDAGGAALQKTSFGKFCGKKGDGFAMVAFSATAGGKKNDPCDFKIADKTYKGLKWECRNDAVPDATPSTDPSTIPSTVPSTTPSNEPSNTPSSLPSPSATPSTTPSSNPLDCINQSPSGAPPISTKQLPDVGPIVSITVTPVKPAGKTPVKTKSPAPTTSQLKGLTAAQKSNVQKMLTSPTRADGAGLADGCQFEAMHQYATSPTGSLVEYYGFCCAQVGLVPNPKNGQRSASPAFSPNCLAVPGYSSISAAYASSAKGPMDSVEIKSCTFKGKIKDYEDYQDPPGEILYCAKGF